MASRLTRIIETRVRRRERNAAPDWAFWRRGEDELSEGRVMLKFSLLLVEMATPFRELSTLRSQSGWPSSSDIVIDRLLFGP